MAGSGSPTLDGLSAGLNLGGAIGGALGSIFGDNPTSNTTGTTNSTGTQTTNSSGSSSTSSGSATSFNIQNMTPEGFAAMLKAMSITEGIATSALANYSKDQAKADALANMQQIFRDYRETELPKVYAGQGGAGLYNTTTGQLMANDAFARATDLANSRILDYTKVYNTALNNDIGSFISALNVNKGSVKQGGESTSGGSSTSSSNTSTTTENKTSNSTSNTEKDDGGAGLFGGLGSIIGAGLSLFT
jgi:hypothetical protein